MQFLRGAQSLAYMKYATLFRLRFDCWQMFGYQGTASMHSCSQRNMMMENDKEKAAEEYLAKHKIRQLFENLTAGLVYERPG